MKQKNYKMLQKNGDFLQTIIVFEKVYQEYLKSTNKALKDAYALKNLINTYIKKEIKN